MNFDQLCQFVEAVAAKGKLPGHAVRMPAPEQFGGSVEDYWYYWNSKRLGRQSIPDDVFERIKPYVETNDKFKEATDLDRPPTPEEKQRLSEAIMELSKRDPVLGNLISLTPVIYVGPYTKFTDASGKLRKKEHRTMCVDARGNLYINLGYANLCNFEQLVGVLAHEMMHLTDKHHIRLRGREPFEYANIATDAFINEQLISNGFEVGAGMGVYAKDKKITIRIMYVADQTTNDIKVADPREFRMQVNMEDKTWEQLFDIIKEKMDDPSSWEQLTFKVGDVVFDKTLRKCGLITKVTRSSWSESDELIIQPLTREEALAKAKAIAAAKTAVIK